jgi:hypothetical protein
MSDIDPQKDSPETPPLMASDAPPGDTYGTSQAGKLLGVSARRVSQLAHDGRLEIVQDKPLRLSAQSVHELRTERSGRGDQRANVPPPLAESVADQVARIVEMVTAETQKAIEVREHLISEVTSHRDELKVELLAERAKVEQLQEQLAKRPRRSWFARGN